MFRRLCHLTLRRQHGTGAKRFLRLVNKQIVTGAVRVKEITQGPEREREGKSEDRIKANSNTQEIQKGRGPKRNTEENRRKAQRMHMARIQGKKMLRGGDQGTGLLRSQVNVNRTRKCKTR